MRRLAAIAAVLLLAAAGLVGVPYLTRDRDYVATTPQPDPLLAVATIAVPGGARACMADAVVDPHSEQARLRVGTFRRGPVPLDVTIRGDGYAVLARVPPTYADSQLLAVNVRPPSRPTEVTVCVHNGGTRRIALFASDDRTRSRRPVEVDGRRVAGSFTLAFFERRRTSIAERLPESLRRASAFRPAVSPLILWPLLALFVVGVPIAVVGAFVAALPRRR